MNGLILLVEDNEQIAYANERMLKRRSYEVMTACTLSEAKQKMRERKPDAIVLDIMMPDGNGLDFLRELRKESNIPVLLLTGLTGSDDIIKGLADGGDDYLTKPYEFSVLLARLEALLRRAERLPEVLHKGLLKLDVMAAQAFFRDEDLLLTQKDFALLLMFTQNEEKTINAEYIYEKLWKVPLIKDKQAIKSAISRLRAKLLGSGYTILAMRGEGYVFKKE